MVYLLYNSISKRIHVFTVCIIFPAKTYKPKLFYKKSCLSAIKDFLPVIKSYIFLKLV